jgi:hypothetical protein
MSSRFRRSSVLPATLALVAFVTLSSACTKPVTTKVAPPVPASLESDQEVVGVVLKDGTERLFDIGSPVLKDGAWVGTASGHPVTVPASDVQQLIVEEHVTDVVSIVAIGVFIGLAITAIAVASPQR